MTHMMGGGRGFLGLTFSAIVSCHYDTWNSPEGWMRHRYCEEFISESGNNLATSSTNYRDSVCSGYSYHGGQVNVDLTEPLDLSLKKTPTGMIPSVTAVAEEERMEFSEEHRSLYMSGQDNYLFPNPVLLSNYEDIWNMSLANMPQCSSVEPDPSIGSSNNICHPLLPTNSGVSHPPLYADGIVNPSACPDHFSQIDSHSRTQLDGISDDTYGKRKDRKEKVYIIGQSDLLYNNVAFRNKARKIVEKHFLIPFSSFDEYKRALLIAVPDKKARREQYIRLLCLILRALRLSVTELQYNGTKISTNVLGLARRMNSSDVDGTQKTIIPIAPEDIALKNKTEMRFEAKNFSILFLNFVPDKRKEYAQRLYGFLRDLTMIIGFKRLHFKSMNNSSLLFLERTGDILFLGEKLDFNLERCYYEAKKVFAILNPRMIVYSTRIKDLLARPGIAVGRLRKAVHLMKSLNTYIGRDKTTICQKSKFVILVITGKETCMQSDLYPRYLTKEWIAATCEMPLKDLTGVEVIDDNGFASTYNIRCSIMGGCWIARESVEIHQSEGVLNY